jgi:hypothetical protein
MRASRFIGDDGRILTGRLARQLAAGLASAIGFVLVLIPEAIGRAYAIALEATAGGLAALVTLPFDFGTDLLTAAGVASAAGTTRFDALALVVGIATVLLTLFVAAWGVSALVGD